MEEFNQDIQYIKGVGPARVTLLHKLGIYTLEDIITYFPREYEDRGNIKKIEELAIGENASFKAIVASRMSESRISDGMTIYKLIVRDDTGSMLLVWFNQTYLKNAFKPGEEYVFFGKVGGNFGR